MQKQVTIDFVRSLQKPTNHYLCQVQANDHYQLDFISFKIRNVETNVTFFEIHKPQNLSNETLNLLRLQRTVQYQFKPSFFEINTIGTTLQFKVGKNAIKNFLMVQRHYFKKQLLRSYEFQIPFCMPNTQNQLESLYEMPELSKNKIKEIIDSPWQTQTDSFYFVDGVLIMHNKAKFSYQE